MTLLNIYMFAVAIAGSLIYYFQAYKIFAVKSAKDVTAMGFILSLFTSINWLIYGIFKGDTPLICSGSLSVIGAALVLLGILYYGKQEN